MRKNWALFTGPALLRSSSWFKRNSLPIWKQVTTTLGKVYIVGIRVHLYTRMRTDLLSSLLGLNRTHFSLGGHRRCLDRSVWRSLRSLSKNWASLNYGSRVMAKSQSQPSLISVILGLESSIFIEIPNKMQIYALVYVASWEGYFLSVPYYIADSSTFTFTSFRDLNLMQYPLTRALPSFPPYAWARYFLSSMPRI